MINRKGRGLPIVAPAGAEVGGATVGALEGAVVATVPVANHKYEKWKENLKDTSTHQKKKN
jgi:hypothetical protein